MRHLGALLSGLLLLGSAAAWADGITRCPWPEQCGEPEVNDLESDGVAGILDNEIPIGTSAGSVLYRALPSNGTNGCDGANDGFRYNTLTRTFTCATDRARVTVSASPVTDPGTACEDGDLYVDTGTPELCVCIDGTTDNWACVVLSD